jgi:hypothetical protein
MGEEEKRGAEEGSIVWGWSTYSDEGFTGAHPSKEHAIAEARDNLGSDFAYTNVYVQAGQYEDVAKILPRVDMLAEHVIEHMSENSYEECGELAEDWPDVSPEQLKELEDGLKTLLEGWARKHFEMPAWAPVGEPELVNKAKED